MRRDELDPPCLMFSPVAWLKWQYLCHAGPTEVAGFGLSDPDDLLYVEDVLVVRQRATAVTVALDDQAVAELFDDLVDAGHQPQEFARLWLHTHPGASVVPSRTDEATFARVFGGCDWAVMAILGRTGRTSARLRFAAGPGGSLDLAVGVDWARWPRDAVGLGRSFEALVAGWQREYEESVVPEELLPVPAGRSQARGIDRPTAREPDPFLDFTADSFHPGGFHAFD